MARSSALRAARLPKWGAQREPLEARATASIRVHAHAQQLAAGTLTGKGKGATNRVMSDRASWGLTGITRLRATHLLYTRVEDVIVDERQPDLLCFAR